MSRSVPSWRITPARHRSTFTAASTRRRIDSTTVIAQGFRHFPCQTVSAPCRTRKAGRPVQHGCIAPTMPKAASTARQAAADAGEWRVRRGQGHTRLSPRSRVQSPRATCRAQQARHATSTSSAPARIGQAGDFTDCPWGMLHQALARVARPEATTAACVVGKGARRDRPW